MKPQLFAMLLFWAGSPGSFGTSLGWGRQETKKKPQISFQVILYVQQRRKYTAWCERQQTIPPTEIQTLVAGGGVQASALLTRRSGILLYLVLDDSFSITALGNVPSAWPSGSWTPLWVVQVEWDMFQGEGQLLCADSHLKIPFPGTLSHSSSCLWCRDGPCHLLSIASHSED